MTFTHHEGVRLCGEGSILCAADADAELHGTAWRVREESLGHVAHDPADTHTQSQYTALTRSVTCSNQRRLTHTDLSALTYCEGTGLQRTPATWT